MSFKRDLLDVLNGDYTDLVKEFHADLLVSLAKQGYQEHEMMQILGDAMKGLRDLLVKRHEHAFDDDMPIDLYTTLVLAYSRNSASYEIVPMASKQVGFFIKSHYK